MRICLFSYDFLPVIGGVQVVGETLALEWAQAGHPVTLATRTPLGADLDFDKRYPFPVVRLSADSTKGKEQWRPILDQTDLIVASGLSLTYWPQWIRRRKPIVFIHHLFLGQEPGDEGISLAERLKRRWRLWFRRRVLRRAAGNVFVSEYIRENIGVPGGVVIYNPIREYFRALANTPITGDFAFFGRMNFEKGATDLLDALQLCNTKGHRFTADLYGEGWMLKDFQARAAKLGLEGQVRWHPFLSGEDLVQAMNSARVVVVPSKWIEPMGIVAVEAMACGKCVIGSSAGGLGEVLSGYCPTYPNQNIEELAKQMIAVMSDSHLRSGYEAAALRRAGDFQQPKKIAADYLNYFQKVLS